MDRLLLRGFPVLDTTDRQTAEHFANVRPTVVIIILTLQTLFLPLLLYIIIIQ